VIGAPELYPMMRATNANPSRTVGVSAASPVRR
jgi:hypothetical protein